MKRRTFVAGAGCVVALMAFGGVAKALDGQGDALRPPGGQDEARFKSLCIKCDRCRGVCPTDCISVSTVEDGVLNARLPKIDFHRGSCTFCNLCIEACPTGALEAFDSSTEKIGVAVVDESICLAFIGGGCDRCNVCSYDALHFDETQCPRVDADACNGCGACTEACVANVFHSFGGGRARAIEVVRA